MVGRESFAVDASLIKADANRHKGIESEKWLPPPKATGQAIDEHLAVLHDAAFGAATEVTPKFISPADPAARWTGAHGAPRRVPPRSNRPEPPQAGEADTDPEPNAA